ncbi:hypothetical protein D3C76_1432880 [compost metagenome]
MDISPLLHAVIAVLVQGIVGYSLGSWGYGAVIGSLWFVAREHTQAEYRWIAQFGNGKRANMPWWGGFDRRAWNLPSLLDWLVPVVACSAVYFVVTL